MAGWRERERTGEGGRERRKLRGGKGTEGGGAGGRAGRNIILSVLKEVG
jgi:hypothetical protein